VAATMTPLAIIMMASSTPCTGTISITRCPTSRWSYPGTDSAQLPFKALILSRQERTAAFQSTDFVTPQTHSCLLKH